MVKGEFRDRLDHADSSHFLNEDRDFASYNEFGKTWYRMPTFGLVTDIVCGAIEAQQGEGYIYDAFEDSDVSGMNDMEASSLMMVSQLSIRKFYPT
jgi:hypothetical protein